MRLNAVEGKVENAVGAAARRDVAAVAVLRGRGHRVGRRHGPLDVVLRGHGRRGRVEAETGTSGHGRVSSDMVRSGTAAAAENGRGRVGQGRSTSCVIPNVAFEIGGLFD